MWCLTFLLPLWITITRSSESRRRKRLRRGRSLVRLGISRNRRGMVAILMECQYRRSLSRVIRPASWGLRRTEWLEQFLASPWSQAAFRQPRPQTVSDIQPWNWKRTPKAPNKPHLPVRSTNLPKCTMQVNLNTRPKLLGKQYREPPVFWIQISPILNMTTKSSKSQILWIIIRDIFKIDWNTTDQSTPHTKPLISLIMAINPTHSSWMTRVWISQPCRASIRKWTARSSWMATSRSVLRQELLNLVSRASSSKGTLRRCHSQHIQISRRSRFRAHSDINQSHLSRGLQLTPWGSPQGCRIGRGYLRSIVPIASSWMKNSFWAKLHKSPSCSVIWIQARDKMCSRSKYNQTKCKDGSTRSTFTHKWTELITPPATSPAPWKPWTSEPLHCPSSSGPCFVEACSLSKQALHIRALRNIHLIRIIFNNKTIIKIIIRIQNRPFKKS